MGRGQREVNLKENLLVYFFWDFFYRELDISVFIIFYIGLIIKFFLDIELNIKVGIYNCSSEIQLYIGKY